MRKILIAFALSFALINSATYSIAQNDQKTKLINKARKYQSTEKASEFPTGLDWLNTDKPITLKSLRGKFVLLDFWTYACINCMHILPDLEKLEKKYKNELVIIGVHSAKFTGEQGTKNIRDAVLRYKIHHPVVNDKDFKIWYEYGAQAWPTLFLINPEGNIIELYIGEGFYNDLNNKLAEAVKEADQFKLMDRTPFNPILEKSKEIKTTLSFPGKIIGDGQSNSLFISDSNNNRILQLDLLTNKVKTIIGSSKSGFKDGNFITAEFKNPQGLFYQDNKIYLADTGNHAVRLIDLNSKSVKTIAGNSIQSTSRVNTGKGTDISLNSPWDLTGVNDNLYIAMAGNHQIWKYNINSTQIIPFTGTGAENIIDGPLLKSALAQPSGISTDGKNLYFADSESSAIRFAGLTENGLVNTIVGTGLFKFGDMDGIGKKAQLQHPLGVVYDNGKLYVADTYNNKIKIIDPLTDEVKTLIGTGKEGKKDGKFLSAELNEPAGIAVINHKLYIADTNNHLIRVADLTSGLISTLNIKMK